MAESIADKILDFIGEFSLIKPEGGRSLSEVAPWNIEETERKEGLTNYKGFQNQDKQLTRGSADGIWDTITQWFGKSAPYTKPTGPGRDDPNQTYPTRAGYKY